MTDRELRLRTRIDTLMDERERLNERCAVLEGRVERYRNQVKNLAQVRQAREMWKARAKGREWAQHQKVGRKRAAA